MTQELDVELHENNSDEEVRQHFNKYLISERINYHLTSNAPEVAAAVDYLCKGVGYTSDRAYTHMRMLICNLYMNYDNWSKRYTHLCLSKGSGKFKHLSQYNHFRINYDPLCKCIRYMIMNRYVRKKKGYWNPKFKDGYETRLIARGKLIRLLEGRFGVRSHMIHPYPDQQTIIVRKTVDEKEITFKSKNDYVKRYKLKIKRPIPYKESTNIKGCRNTIKQYNELLWRSHIDIDLCGFKENITNDEYIDLSKKHVRRIFSENTKQGGRFYGGWWQQVNKKLRKHIIINGRHTAEIDYAGLHIHILYALRDKKLGTKEPYIIPKSNDPDNKRSLYKRLMLAGVNAGSDKGCIESVIDEVYSNPEEYPPAPADSKQFRKHLKSMLNELKEHHSPIAKDINSGKGLRAQYIDSEIAYKVITKMTDKGVPILCIHDSFICRDIDIKEVKHAMVQAYIDVIHRETSRRKNRIILKEEDVKSTIESIIERLEEYKYIQKDEVLHALNPVFRKTSSYYERYLLYLASRRTKATFNVTINVKEEVENYKQIKKNTYKNNSTETIREYCHATLIEDVLRYRTAIESNEEYTSAMLMNTVLTAYPGGFCPPAQVLSGFTKLQKISGTAPWLSATGTNKHKTNMTARNWFKLKR